MVMEANEKILEYLLFGLENMQSYQVPKLSQNEISGIYDGKLILCLASGRTFEVECREIKN
jgi:hypothetical protein